jgi:inhibitor of the pro-sigma K processing machinery
MMDHIAVIAIVAGIIMLLMLAGAPLKPFRFIGMSIIRVLVGALLLFVLNVIGAQLNLHIPINLITASVCGFLGIPGLGALAVIQMYLLS